MTKKVAVIGMGYVGMPLAVSAANSGFEVVGIDNDLKKVNLFNSGAIFSEEIGVSQKEHLKENSKMKATNDFTEVQGCDVVLICVPTPLDANRKPDLRHVETAVRFASKYIKNGVLIILESTVEPGTTRNFVIPLIEKESNLSRDQFYVAFSPERIDPMNREWGIKNTPKLVAGYSSEASELAIDFYRHFIAKIIRCDNLEIAETAKLLENSYRLINISFINEFSVFCNELGVDVQKVIAAASSKPYGFMPFYPSVGVGGHCIPIDPIYLANTATRAGAPLRMIELASEINDQMPKYFVRRARQLVGELKEKKVLVIGVSYKPNVSDIRETPVQALIADLRLEGAKVFWHDDLVKEWNGETSVNLSDEYHLAILATPHNYLDLTKLGNVPILNTRGSI